MIENKKILYVSNYPIDSSASAAIRNKNIIVGFIKKGFEVHTLTRIPENKNSYEGIIENYLESKAISYTLANTLKKKSGFVWWLRVRIASFLSKINMYDNQRILLKNLENIALIEKEFKYVISSSDSKVSHLIAEYLLKNKKINAEKWIQYWGDPFFKDVNITPFIPKKKIFQEELRVLKLADIIMYTSPFTLDEQRKLYPECSKKMYFIPTPYIKEEIIEEEPNEKFTVGYYGSYYKKDRNLKPFLNIIGKMKDINFEIIGASDLKVKNEENLILKKPMKKSEVLEYEKKCNVLICLGNRSGSFQIPGKLYHYAATNKPIIYIYENVNKEVALFFEKYNRYVFCENEEKEIINAILEIKNKKNYEFKPIPDFKVSNVIDRILEIAK